jgi:hypothetical protein
MESATEIWCMFILHQKIGSAQKAEDSLYARLNIMQPKDELTIEELY